jgi:hypothetical protein
MKLSKTFVDNTDLDINWDALEASLAPKAIQKEAAKDAPVTEKQLDASRGADANPESVTEANLEKDRKEATLTLVENLLEKSRKQ